jgi:glycosyltransferase involved in cell wall biosynthesis
LYQSLCAQTFRDFEWVIVDDGSMDGTRELVTSWKPFFPIRYTWKPNGGMHTALNVGTRDAQGEFITQVDSDDYCVPHALERFDNRWRQIPDPDRFACLIGLCYQQDGVTILGSSLPRDFIDTFRLKDALALIDADRWGIIRTDVCRKFPFPEFPNERFLDPSVVYNRILSRYGARYFNEALKVVCYAPGHMSGGPDHRWSSPRGAVVFHTELMGYDVPLKARLKSAINAFRFGLAVPIRGLYLLARRH